MMEANDVHPLDLVGYNLGGGLASSPRSRDCAVALPKSNTPQ
jgi:hypothetical protein